MQDLRVLHLIPTLADGGAERQLAYLCEGLAAMRCPTEVAVLLEGSNLERIQAAGVTVHRLPSPTHRDPLLFAHIVRLIRRVEPRVVQTWIPVMDVVGGAAALWCGVPWILTERSSELNYLPTTLRVRLRDRLARRAAAVVSNSRGGDEYWKARLPARVRRQVIPNAVPLDELDTSERLREIGFGLRERPLVLYVGRMEASKNVDGLLEVFRRVVERRPCVALFCGDGPRREDIAAQIRTVGLGDRVACAGLVRNVASYLHRAAVFVSLSEYEGMPNAVIEAMAARCPMVLSDIPGHRDLVGDAAIWVDGSDVEAVAAAVEGVLDRPEDAVARVEAARRIVDDRSIAAAAEVFVALYGEVAR